ncbi:hypothetical protein COLO4_18918 [Corchorus olitorius]|uniref:Pheophorbide a oxygenase n=1 Tax=Corchorus olitorius TaxID=93759 RepID=A0A1R3J7C0_9ROSI|nr:hypothetical protein COLO4_18918 [Corchorus olitorius]
MDVLRASYAIVLSPCMNPINKTQFLTKPNLTHQNLMFKPLVHKNTSKSKLFTALPSSNPATLTESMVFESGEEKFDWYSEWYPVMPVHTFKKACVGVYPSTMQHGIVWFWPNTDPQYKDIIMKKKPPYFPVLEDPSFTKMIGNRDFPYGYEVLIENLMDPAHVPYAHYGLMRTRTPTVKVDREGGRPLDMSVKKLDERKIENIGGSKNWQNACFVPTKSDALVVGFRRWLNKYSDGEVDWRGKFSGALPPSPPRERLLERCWSHVVNCKSCNTAHKGLNALEVILQVISVGLIGIVAATKQNAMSMVARTTMVSMAIICFAASRWLAHFIKKIFHYHDYNHALH